LHLLVLLATTISKACNTFLRDHPDSAYHLTRLAISPDLLRAQTNHFCPPVWNDTRAAHLDLTLPRRVVMLRPQTNYVLSPVWNDTRAPRLDLTLSLLFLVEIALDLTEVSGERIPCPSFDGATPQFGL
jgi:hypothetical protein